MYNANSITNIIKDEFGNLAQVVKTLDFDGVTTVAVHFPSNVIEGVECRAELVHFDADGGYDYTCEGEDLACAVVDDVDDIDYNAFAYGVYKLA